MIVVNGKEFKKETFPNGEVKLELDVSSLPADIFVDFYYEKDEELLHLAFLKRHISEVFPVARVGLFIGYMPYSRMDRAVKSTSVFTLKYVADLINSLGFTKVTVLEPHSDVTTALINRSEAVSVTKDLVELAGFNPENTMLVYPDAGAYKRYTKLFPDVKFTAVGLKDRDVNTGKIKLDLVCLNGSPEGITKAIIIDDLCSYGSTFLACAEKLRATTSCTEINLAVTHCENSIFRGALLGSRMINKVFTTDSLISSGMLDAYKHVFNILSIKKLNISSTEPIIEKEEA